MEQKHSEAPASTPASSSRPLGFRLAPEEIDEIAEHLQGCPPCLEFIESLKTTVQLCKDLGSTEQPSPLDPATHQRMLDAYEAMRKARTQGEK